MRSRRCPARSTGVSPHSGYVPLSPWPGIKKWRRSHLSSSRHYPLGGVGVLRWSPVINRGGAHRPSAGRRRSLLKIFSTMILVAARRRVTGSSAVENAYRLGARRPLNRMTSPTRAGDGTARPTTSKSSPRGIIEAAAINQLMPFGLVPGCHQIQSSGAGGQAGSGSQLGGGCHPAAGLGQPGGGVHVSDLRSTEEP